MHKLQKFSLFVTYALSLEDKNVEERTATVQGTFSQVKLAIKLINDLLFGVEVPAACVNFFWKIPSDKLGIVLGKGGCRVKQVV